MRNNYLILLIVMSVQLSACEMPETEAQAQEGMSTTKKVILGGAIVIGAAGVAVVAVPTAAGCSAVAAAATGAKVTVVTIAAVKKAALGVVAIRCICGAGHYLRQYVCPTEEQQVRKLEREMMREKSLAEQIEEHNALHPS